jgi:hypothetical protein
LADLDKAIARANRGKKTEATVADEPGETDGATAAG